MIAWMFTLPLVMDKRLDFWSAMELSRKVVTKHWFKFFGFGIVMLLLTFAGALALGFGLFVTTPWILAGLMYAYEDIFGNAGPAAKPAATGPGGTLVMPRVQAQPAHAPGTMWTPATIIGLSVVALAICVMLGIGLVRHVNFFGAQRARAHPAPAEFTAFVSQHQQQVAAVSPAAPAQMVSPAAFGPVMEHELTNFSAIKLASGAEQSLPVSVTEMNRGPEKDSAATAWLENNEMDFAFIGSYDGFYGMTRDMATLPRDGWEQATPASVAESLHDNGQDTAAKFGDSSRLNNPTNYTYAFKTRDGFLGLLQVITFTENPPGVKLRYKLSQPANVSSAMMPAAPGKYTHEDLVARLEAAAELNFFIAKDKALAGIAVDAAKSGDVEVVQKAIGQMTDWTKTDAAKHDVALLLAKHGLRKQAIEIAKEITQVNLRDQALSELAQ
jgi:hypothetical protein